MAKKLQSFTIFKFLSSRLKHVNYNLNINLQEARNNLEIIRLGDSTLLSVLRKVENKFFDENKLKLLEQEKRIQEKQNNRKEVVRLMKEIDNFLFVDSLIEIKFDNKKHYGQIIKRGLFINGEEFVRLLAGSGNLRRNTVFFVKKSIFEKVIKILNNDHNQNIEFNPAKFAAYMGLYNSSGHAVSFPRFCVVPDYHFIRSTKVDWINDDNTIEEKEIDVDLNCFDGQGIISVELARQWANELELDYLPSTFIFRAPFAKGQLVVFDIHLFSDEIAQSHEILDVWGDKHDIRDVDILISQSQLKLWNAYKNLKEYIYSCLKNDLGFRISRFSSKKQKEQVATNYMFLQVLNMSDEDVENFCRPTLDYFEGLLGEDRNKMLIYSHPEISESGIKSENFDATSLALMFDEKFANEPHIITKYHNSLKKKFKESYLGNLIVKGNFQPLIADPFMQMESVFGLETFGLLKDDEHFCSWWTNQNIYDVASARSPLTHTSEMNRSKLVHTNTQGFWYQYIADGFIIGAKGIDTLLYADADFDGDLVFTTNNEYIIRGRQPGNPITYAKKSASKQFIKVDDLWKFDILGFNSKVGFITNISSTFHCLISQFEDGSLEKEELLNRLKILRLLQGEAIDQSKNGGLSKTIPDYWAKRILKSDASFSQDEKDFYNRIVAIKRPRFMRHLYHHYGRNYTKEKNRQERKLLETRDSEIVLERTDRNSSFIDNDSVMNRIEKYMVESVQKIKDVSWRDTKSFDYTVLLKFPIKTIDLNYAKKINDYYWSFRRQIPDDTNITEYSKEFAKNIELEIIKDEKTREEVFDWLVFYLYREKKGKSDILWSCFSDIIIERIRKDIVYVPVEDMNGDIEYLNSKYALKGIRIV